MFKFILKRILQAVPVLFGILTIVFFVMRVFAQDPVALLLGEAATGPAIAALREHLGLDQPVLVQYAIFMKQVFTGDMGVSIHTKLPVLPEILKRIPATFELGLFAFAISTVIGVSVGIISAVFQNTFLDRTIVFLGLIGASLPVFWFGLMLIQLFGVNLAWLPISGRIPVSMNIRHTTGFLMIDSLISGNFKGFTTSLRHIIMPAMCLGIISAAGFARLTRSTMLEVIRQDYIRTARSKGLKESVVILKHALKNASIPIVTAMGMQLGGIVGGAVLTETIFSWPGVGTYMVIGINQSDYSVVQAGAVVLAISFVMANMCVDILYGYLDPKIRHS